MPNPTTAAEWAAIREAVRKSRPPHNCRETQVRRVYPYLKCQACREEWLEYNARQWVEAFRERAAQVVEARNPHDHQPTWATCPYQELAAAIRALTP